MARIRTIKPSIFSSLTVSSWPIELRWMFAGMFTYLDDHGRGLDETRLIKAELFPLDDKITARRIDAHLNTLQSSGPLCRYEVDGCRYLHITSWREHQRVSHPSPSKCPPCPVHDTRRDA